MMYEQAIGQRVFIPLDEKNKKNTLLLRIFSFFYFWEKKKYYISLNEEMFL